METKKKIILIIIGKLAKRKSAKILKDLIKIIKKLLEESWIKFN